MAARAYWKGFLRLSLVSIPVEIYNAVETKSEISFRQIHKPSGRRINYTKTVQGIGEVKSSDIVKGYEVDSDTYVTLEPDEIDAVKLESKKTIDLVQVRRRRGDRPALFRAALFHRPGRQAFRRRLRRHPRSAEEDRQGRPRPADHRRARVAGRHHRARRRPADGDAALRRRAEGARPTSSTRCRPASPTRRWSTSPSS